MLLSLWLLNYVDHHSYKGREYGLLILFALFGQQTCKNGIVCLLMMCRVFCMYVCSYAYMSVGIGPQTLNYQTFVVHILV